MSPNVVRSLSGRSDATTFRRTGTSGSSAWPITGPETRTTPWKYHREMSAHTWPEHVVHVELVSDDPDITSETLRFLEHRFADREAEALAEPGGVPTAQRAGPAGDVG